MHWTGFNLTQHQFGVPNYHFQKILTQIIDTTLNEFGTCTCGFD